MGRKSLLWLRSSVTLTQMGKRAEARVNGKRYFCTAVPKQEKCTWCGDPFYPRSTRTDSDLDRCEDHIGLDKCESCENIFERSDLTDVVTCEDDEGQEWSELWCQECIDDPPSYVDDGVVGYTENGTPILECDDPEMVALYSEGGLLSEGSPLRGDAE